MAEVRYSWCSRFDIWFFFGLPAAMFVLALGAFVYDASQGFPSEERQLQELERQRKFHPCGCERKQP